MVQSCADERKKLRVRRQSCDTAIVIHLESGNLRSHLPPLSQQFGQVVEQLLVVHRASWPLILTTAITGRPLVFSAFQSTATACRRPPSSEYAASTRHSRIRSDDCVTARRSAGVHLRCQIYASWGRARRDTPAPGRATRTQKLRTTNVLERSTSQRN